MTLSLKGLLTKREIEWPTLVCPTHGYILTESDRGLECPRNETFAVTRGIPRFVKGELYVSAFGAQWNHYRRTQLDSYTGIPISERRLRRCLGEDLWTNLHGKHVLECGCGAGRFTEILLREGAFVTSVDLSEAVDANASNFPQDDTHRVIQADILELPFTKEGFDVVLCLGVVQHTPNSLATARALWRHVAPGGFCIFDHYRLSFSELTKAGLLLRPMLRHLSPTNGLTVVQRLVNFWFPLHCVLRNSPILQMSVNRISPILTYFRTYPELSTELHREWAHLDTHDYLTSWYRRRISESGLKSIIASFRAETEYFAKVGDAFECRVRRSGSVE